MNALGRIREITGVIFVWFVYSSSYWYMFGVNVVRQKDPEFEIRFRALEYAVLILTTAVQVRWSGIADKYNCYDILVVCVLVSHIPILFHVEVFGYYEYFVLAAQHLLYSLSLTLVIPASSKIFAKKFRGKSLNLAFSFLMFSPISAKAFARFAILSLAYDEDQQPLLQLTSFGIALVVFWLGVLTWLERADKLYHNAKVSLENLHQIRLVNKFAVCIMFMRFAKECVLQNLITRGIIDPESEILSSMSGIFMAVLLSLVSPEFGVITYTSMMNVFCFAAVLVCLVLAVYGVFHRTVFLALFGVYFSTVEAFLGGSLAISVGNIDGNGAKAVGIVLAFGNMGQIAAYVVLDVFHSFYVYILTLFVSMMYSYSLYGVRMFIEVEKQYLPGI